MKILNVIITFVNFFLLGAIITNAWSWFLVPLGVSDLKNYAHALGLSTLASFFNGSIGIVIKLYTMDSETNDYYSLTLFVMYIIGFVALFIFKSFL